MKSFIREVVGFLLVQLRFFYPSQRLRILSVYFHNPSPAVFDRMMRWLLKNHYCFISVEELHRLIVDKHKPDKKYAVITFDDGWNGNLKLINSIEKHGIPVTIFVPTGPVVTGNFWWEYTVIKGQEKITAIKKKQDFKKLPGDIFSEKIRLLQQKYQLSRSCITLEELKDLSRNKLITIGSHTVSHPILNNCSATVQEYEMNKSKSQLEDWIGKEVKYFSYPNGDYNDDSLNIARQAGYEVCFTVEPKKIDVEADNPYLLARYATNDKGGYFENISKILGIWQKFDFREKFL